jgi:Ca-activated chloride channel family protein
MYDAVYLALEKLKHAANSRRALLLITDGEDNHSRYSASSVKELIKEQDVQIYAIGTGGFEFERGRPGQTVIEELTKMTGGRAFFPMLTNELDDVCRKIGTLLKGQYVLGYRSTNERQDGRWRRIQVKLSPSADTPHLHIRARAGYYPN